MSDQWSEYDEEAGYMSAKDPLLLAYLQRDDVMFDAQLGLLRQELAEAKKQNEALARSGASAIIGNADLREQLAAAKAEIERQRERAEKHLRELPVVVSKLNKCREQHAAILNQRPTLVAKVVRELVEEHAREIERQHMAVRKAAVENYPAAKAGLDAGEFKLEDLTQTFGEDLADLVALIELARINGTVASDKSDATIAAQAAEIERLKGEAAK